MKRYRRDGEYSYALGMSVVFELLKHRRERVTAVYVHPDATRNEHLERLIGICESSGIEIKYESKIFNILSQRENCFVIAEFEKYGSKLDGDAPHIVLVEASNSGNAGTIMRTALGLGYRDIALIPPCIDMFSPETVRASMGALFALNVCEFGSIEQYVKAYPKHALYPFMLTASKAIEDVEFKAPYSLVFGNEAHGLPETYAARGQSVVIPCSKEIDSLNLSVAAAIGMYVAKKRKK